ncbi:MAG: hypothetical protein R3C49_22135 [Planctomycetaceae bacterium]
MSPTAKFLLPALVLLTGLRPAVGQLIRAPLDSGFVRTSSIAVTVDEMLGSQKTRSADEPVPGPGYPALWIAEVQFKSVRHRLMEVVDPKTGAAKEELVWYLVYRFIPRDYTELAGDSRDELLKKLNDPDFRPQNGSDPVEAYPLQLPRFVLTTDDSEDRTKYADEVNLQIQQAVFQREFAERASSLKLLNSVQAMQEAGEPVSVSDPDPLANAVYGVAIWRNLDPTIDYFTITMSGFSNAYRFREEDGQLVVEEKVIVQRFGRPGDEFLQQESEFRLIDAARLSPAGDLTLVMDGSNSTFVTGRPAPVFIGELRERLEKLQQSGQPAELTWPEWRYQARPATIDIPDFQSILRNAAVTAEKP